MRICVIICCLALADLGLSLPSYERKMIPYEDEKIPAEKSPYEDERIPDEIIPYQDESPPAVQDPEFPMTYEEITQAFQSTYLQSSTQLGIGGCVSKEVSLDKGKEHIFDCSGNPQQRPPASKPGSSGPMYGRWPDDSKCCETYQAQLDLTYHTFQHPWYGTVYPVQFPSRGLYQTAPVAFCKPGGCSTCEAQEGLHTFLVSRRRIPDPPPRGTSIRLLFHTEALPMYCKCIG